MAIAYLNEGATSFAAANWSDATGFATNATLVISSGSQVISGALDQSAVVTGINSLHIRSGFSGRIGGPTPLKVDADAGAPNLISYGASAGAMYLQAGGGSAVITNLYVGTGGQAYLLGGTFTNVYFSRGYMSVNESTVATNAYLFGGSSVFEAGTVFTVLNVFGGNHVIKRACATVNVFGGSVVYDVPTSEATTATVNVYQGATFRHMSSRTVTAMNVYGTYDPTDLRIDVTLTALNVYPFGKYQLTGKAATVTATPALVGIREV